MDFHERFWSKVEVAQPWECWEWKAGKNYSGYGKFSLNRRSRNAHRIIYEHLNGPVGVDIDICHHCDNPGCCNPAHLFAGTRRDNVQDCIKKGRFKVVEDNLRTEQMKKGEEMWSAKLTEADVQAIRRFASIGITHRRISEIFGIGGSQVSRIHLRQKWAHLDTPPNPTPSGGNGDKTYD